MKKLETISGARNSQKTIAVRMKWVLNIEKENIDFENCVSIDESGFNFHIQRTFGQSRRGLPAKAVVSSDRGVNATILEAITTGGVINLSLRRPQTAVAPKKQKLDSGEAQFAGEVGTRTRHFLDFLKIVMDVLDKNNMHEKTLIMNNANPSRTIRGPSS